MKMSGYFKKPRVSETLQKKYQSTAETLQHYEELNAELDEYTSNPVVKLRVASKNPMTASRKPPRKDKKTSSRLNSSLTLKEKSLHEIELIDGRGIFNE